MSQGYTNRIFSWCLAAAALLSILPQSATAQTIVATVSDSSPTDNIEISNTSTPGASGTANYAWKAYTGDTRDIGETFTVGSTGFTMDAFTIQVALVYSGALGADFSMSLNTYADASTATPSSNVWTETGTLPLSISTDDYLTFDVPDTLLKANTTYGITLAFLSEEVARGINFYITYGNSYDGGVLVASTDGTTWTSPTSNDFTNFYIQSIPEPATVGLIFGASIFGLVLLRRRRSRR